ncbi:Kelch motif family protein [Trichomonas vaginalis G3]|uniref:Kelch motif family protein n=1 Tax=Trichomonas vaginalis (strain ATCC PRA-98 / G3) TaxID=412133 RepID=A2FHX9_TRIV3|nr:Rho guanyl-nucleotide exchange factor protein [Trichomonas vaginalis G3]EAX95488.1 Kelch motif family protein [Trichomonas vaginalis G3]KAI5531079.1 Rho guanyl-nucleotide exchange factor protein [Trichomonas vaginalis G3]|eukprot:XP_001308418.1 Kelch motif family protein [Trichomonas vaginalis G3]
MSLCVIHGTSPNIVLPADSYMDKSCSEILNAVNHQGCLLAYRCPFYTEVLKLEDIPLKMHEELILHDDLEDYPAPEYYLKVIPESDKNYFWIEVEISTQLKDQMPLMLVSIETNELNTLTVQNIFLACKACFGYDFTEEKLSIGDRQLEMSEPAEPILQQCRSEHIKLNVVLGDAGKRKIGARGHITAEIISTEETYNNDLKMLLEYWEPEFRKSTAFQEGEIHSLFREIKTIYQVHSAFLEDLKKIKPGFTAEMSYVFLKHLQNFTKAKVFVSAYKPIDDMLKKKRMVRSVDKQISEIEANMPLHNGRNFMSYYITPVQRYPRYPLLFRELDKSTPSFHPEKHYISMTMQKLNEVNKNIDQLSHKIISIQAMQDIQNTMPPGTIIMDHGREIIEQAVVRIVSTKKTGPGVLYLFNNMVMLAITKKKINTPLLQFEPSKFKFANCKPVLTSIYVVDDDEAYQIDFNDISEKMTWLDQYHNLLSEIFREYKSEKPAVKWTDVELSETVAERVSHDGCVSSGFVYYFGGTNESRSTTSTIIRYNIADSIWSIENAQVPPRESHSITALRENLYVAFGNNSNKVYSDIWCYNQAKRTWTEIVPANGKPSPRFGHTCVVYDSKLYFFGGKVTNKMNDKDTTISNCVSYYDPHNNEFRELGELPNSPPPRYNHAAVLIGKSEMAIIGGRGPKQQTFDDIWVLDMLNMTWSKRSKASVSARHDCRASVIADRWLFVSGGAADSQSEDIVVIDTKHWLKVEVEHFGNIPPNLCKHSSIAIDSHRFMIYGGTERVSHRSYPSAWICECDEAMPIMSKMAPQTVENYWEKEMIQAVAAGRAHRAQSVDPSTLVSKAQSVDPSTLVSKAQSVNLQVPPPPSVQPGSLDDVTKSPELNVSSNTISATQPSSRHTISGLQATPFSGMQATPFAGFIPKKARESPAPKLNPIDIAGAQSRRSNTNVNRSGGGGLQPTQSPGMPPAPPPPPPATTTKKTVVSKEAKVAKDSKKDKEKEKDPKKDKDAKKDKSKVENLKPREQPPSEQAGEKKDGLATVDKKTRGSVPNISVPSPVGITAADIANSRINLRRQKSKEEMTNIRASPLANASNDSANYDEARKNFTAKGEKFVMSEFYRELGIDVSSLNIFEQNATKIKSSKLWQKSYENNELSGKVAKLENLLTGNSDPPEGMTFLVKVFDDNMRTSKIMRISTATKLDDVLAKVDEILQKNDAILTIAIGKGRTQPLSQESLYDAMRNVYKGLTRCITINAI